MMTASQSATPDNDYGWGIIDVLAAVNYSFGDPYLPGDLNYDVQVDAVDLMMEIDIVFFGDTFPLPPVTPDITLDGAITVTDIVYRIDYIFRAGPEPPLP